MRRNTRKKSKNAATKMVALFMIAILIIMIFASSSNNKSGKLQTSIDKDPITEEDLTTGKITEDKVIKAALRVAMYGYNGMPYLDCSTYVGRVIETLGGTLRSTSTDYPSPYGAITLYSGYVQYTREGQTYTLNAPVMECLDNPESTKWYEAEGIDATQLRPGDIISSKTHAFIYIGKANDLEGITNQLTAINGGNAITLTSNTSSVETGKLNYFANNGETYWYIEGNVNNVGKSPVGTDAWNGTSNRPYLRNYAWNYPDGNKTMNQIRVYRISEREEYTGGVGVYKYKDLDGDKEWDPDEPGLIGAKFKLATAQTGGEYLKKDGRDYEATTNEQGYACFEGIDLGTETEKTYYLEETFVPTGYIGMTSRLAVTVKSDFEATNLDSYHKVGNEEVKYSGKAGVYKFEDLDGDKEWDPDEPALKGATFGIAATEADARNKNFIATKTTGEDGIALFENLNLGTETSKKFYIKETVSPEGFNLIDEVFEVTARSDNNIDYTDVSNLLNIGNQKKIYDLALRKYITAVKDGATGETTEVTDRVPKITIPENFNTADCTTLEYKHTKDPVLVHTTDIVTYNIEIFNEGPSDAYSELTKDDIPQGLVFLPDSELNKEYRWYMVDENDNEVTDASKAKYIVTDYLSKEQGEDNLIKAFDPETMEKPDSRIIKVQFKVTEPTTSNRILINHAQIMKETDEFGKDVTDRDSHQNEWLGEDDEDYEQVRVLYFDLALRKWVVEAIVTKDGNETVYQTGHKAEDDPEAVVKVDLKKSDLSKVTVKFRFKIRIKNEGEIAGEAKTVRDDVPKGLKFVQEDNPDWREENGKIVTNKLANVTLQPGESVEMDIILTWINGEDNMGVMTNISEIEEDHNDYGAHDIDSTPGNKKSGEDDIDDAPVMLAIKTGSEVIKYVALGVGLVAFIGISGIIIKRKVLNY